MSKAAKIILTVFILLLITAVGIPAASLLFIKLEVLPDVTIELGTKGDINPALFCTGMSERAISKTELEGNPIDTRTGAEHAEGMESLPVGSYTINLKRGLKKAQSTLTVIDTTPPAIKIKEQYPEMEMYDYNYDFSKLVEITDHDTIQADIDTKEVDILTAGTYPVHIKAEDASGNKAEAELTLTVVDYYLTNESYQQDSKGMEPDENENPETQPEIIENIEEKQIKITRKKPSRQEVELKSKNYITESLSELPQWKIDYYTREGYNGVFSDGR